ncbi:CbtA family protein [Paraburkholderia sp. JHI869]|uniref:CbtA family protein n=1 Tax=Paraburkholderia sp. JHI869 TaxID=3112959 RepID=UPI00317B82BC
MVSTLLARGMIVGILAGLLCFGLLRIIGEPQVNAAITFETQLDHAKEVATAQALIAKGSPVPQKMEMPELVSRPVQAGIGLFTAVMVYSVAFGGLFALTYACAYGRMGNFDARTTAVLLAILGLVAVYVVPILKYPANPPAVGDPETIGARTALYFGMVAISLAAMIAAVTLRLRLLPRLGPWNAFLIAAGAYLIVVVVAGFVLPPVNEVPAAFPAVVLWRFRIASLGGQVVMWMTFGFAFGALTERAAARASRPRARVPGRARHA